MKRAIATVFIVVLLAIPSSSLAANGLGTVEEWRDGVGVQWTRPDSSRYWATIPGEGYFALFTEDDSVVALSSNLPDAHPVRAAAASLLNGRGQELTGDGYWTVIAGGQ